MYRYYRDLSNAIWRTYYDYDGDFHAEWIKYDKWMECNDIFECLKEEEKLIPISEGDVFAELL